MAAAIVPEALGALSAVGGLFGGSNKNALRDQQEAQRFSLAKGGDVTSAQGIYHDSLPENKQTAERIKDDQGYWQQLRGLGWTVDASGTVHPPAAAGRVVGSIGWTANAPASMTGAAPAPGAGGTVTYSTAGGDVVTPAKAPSVIQSHAVAFGILGVTALVAILFMFRSHFA
jgi:hypothetical protein